MVENGSFGITEPLGGIKTNVGQCSPESSLDVLGNFQPSSFPPRCKMVLMLHSSVPRIP